MIPVAGFITWSLELQSKKKQSQNAMLTTWKVHNVKMQKHWICAFRTDPLAYVTIPNFHGFEADVSEY